MTVKIVTNPDGTTREVYVADGWKQAANIPGGYADTVAKRPLAPHQRRKVAQEVYMGRRLNLLHNNTMHPRQVEQFRAWLGDFLRG